MSNRASATALKEPAADQATASIQARKYLFAIVYAADAQPCTCPGMDEKEVSTITEGRLAAVVSGVTGPKSGPNEGTWRNTRKF